MICDITCPAVSSKVLKAFNTANLLTEMQMLSDWHIVKHETAHAIFIRHFLYAVFEYTKHMSINARPILDSV